jgi:hypothetical protein
MMPNTADMEETTGADMGGILVMEATMAETAMEVTMAVMEVTMAVMVDMAVAEGAATMDVVGRVTMERGVVDAALMLVKLLMLKPKPSLKTKLIKQHSYLNYGAHFRCNIINEAK